MNSRNAGFDDGASFVTSVQTLTATGGGKIDLSGLTTITPPARAEDRVDIVLSDASSSIDLSGLKTISAAGGATRIVLSNGAGLDLAVCLELGGVFFGLSGAAQLTVTGAAPVAYTTTG